MAVLLTAQLKIINEHGLLQANSPQKKDKNKKHNKVLH